jgi:hypothetical protein
VGYHQTQGASQVDGQLLITPQNIYNTQAKMVENAGFKNVADFFTDPKNQPLPPVQPPQDPAIQIEQMRQQGAAQKFQAETQQSMTIEQLKAQAKLQEVQANLELQASNDQRDGERAAMQAQYDANLADMKLQLERYQSDQAAEMSRYKTDADNQTRILVAQINAHVKAQNAMQAMPEINHAGGVMYD